MGETHKHNVERKKPETKDFIACDSMEAKLVYGPRSQKVVTPGEELCLEGNTRGFLGAGNVVS